MQKFSFHTHTVFSDGKNSIQEMVEKAKLLGFDKIGISDHLIVHKNITQTRSYEEQKRIYHQSFDEVVAACNKHAEDIRKAQKTYGVKTFVGYEVDYFTYKGWEDELRDFLTKIDYDYIISGNHFLMSEDGEKIFDIWRFKDCDDALKGDIKTYIKRHFETLAKAVRSNLFMFLAHPDYVQKIEVYREQDYQSEINALIDALMQTNTPCEISTKGLRKFGHFFPSDHILQKMLKQNIAFIISDDAHNIDELGIYFEKAEEQLASFGCKKRLIPE